MNLLLVAIGGAVGSVARYGAVLAAARLTGSAYPFATLFVNVTGSFLIAFLLETILRRLGGSEALRLLLLTGFLGGYTTFSTFSLDALTLYERDGIAIAGGYVILSVGLGLGAAVLGLVLARAVG